tara:strand:+ start:4652 stop:5980 length:1329 start_codon:yes stop_codon:yes gene_type:complete
MSKKSPIQPGSPQVHRERLIILIKALKEAKGKITYQGYTYDLQGKESDLDYKKFVLDVIGMTESAFNKYIGTDIEKISAYSTSGKTLKEQANFIHTIEPYLTIDGGREDRTNSLHIDGAFGFKNNRPQMPADKTFESKFGPMTIKATQSINQDNVSQHYFDYIDRVCKKLFIILFSPEKISEIFPYQVLPYGKFVDEYINEPDSKLEVIAPIFFRLNIIINKRYQDLLYLEEVTDSIPPGYKGMKQTHSDKQLWDRYKNKFKGPIKNLTLSDFTDDELIDFRYELLWAAKDFDYDYKDWPAELKSLMLIVNLEESSFMFLFFSLTMYLIAHTRFIITSSTDGIKPVFRTINISITELTDLLKEYQIDDFDKDFTKNSQNLLAKKIHLKPVIERAKSDSLNAKLESHIKALIFQLYSKKIEEDLNFVEKNNNMALIFKALSNS